MSSEFVFLSTISWDDSGGAHRPVQFARQLLRLGHRVLFVQVEPSRQHPAEPRLTLISLADLGLSERARRYVWFGREPQGLDAVNEQLAAQLDAFADSSAERRIVIWCAPYILFVRWWALFRQRGYLTVYDCLDDFDGLGQLGFFFSSPAGENLLVTHCDLVLVGSLPLLSKFAALLQASNVHLLRSGFDPETFRQAHPLGRPPVGLVRGECTLGFWGVIADWTIDVEGLECVAQARPSWSINLLGDCDPEPTRPPVAPRLRASPNVHLLGRVPQERLPDYLAAFDICLIPFADNAYNTGREPIKVYQYLGGLKPVVALHAPQLKGMPGVFLADTPKEFLLQIEHARASRIDRGAVETYLAGCTWGVRTAELLGLIAQTPILADAERVVLPSFYPEPDLPEHWSAYIAHTERTEDERSVYIANMEREWQATQNYLRKLERTHPLLWLRRAYERLRRRN